MTLPILDPLGFGSSASHDPKTSANFTAQISPLPRISLRKRAISTVSSPSPTTQLTSVNSAFLEGLFADVKSVQEQHDVDAAATQVIQTRLDPAQLCKKSRLSSSMSRCGRSFKTLDDAAMLASPKCAADIFLDIKQPATISPPLATYCSFKTYHSSKTSLQRQDSLFYQLDCVSSCESTAAGHGDSGSGAEILDTAASLTFPHLPPTVSNASCNKLTRVVSNLQDSAAENTTHEECYYGWFVEMEDPDQAKATVGAATINNNNTDPYHTSKDLSSLAFCAPTAPKAVNYDHELQWAQAADTVDDVLGDFF